MATVKHFHLILNNSAVYKYVHISVIATEIFTYAYF